MREDERIHRKTMKERKVKGKHEEGEGEQHMTAKCGSSHLHSHDCFFNVLPHAYRDTIVQENRLLTILYR